MNQTAPPSRPARIIPVLDVMNGEVVRAVGGRRERYQVTPSKLVDSTRPADVAEALLKATGVNELYVADIDALQGHRPHLAWVRDLTARGVRVMVDAGVRRSADAVPVFNAGASVIVGTETLASAEELKTLAGSLGSDGLILSVDLRNGRVVGDEAVWGADPDAASVVALGVKAGLKRFIVLELARVGTGIGPGTVDLCRQLRAAYPNIELIAGGGVRDASDMAQLGEAGADGVLVASALHEKTLVKTSDQ